MRTRNCDITYYRTRNSGYTCTSTNTTTFTSVHLRGYTMCLSGRILCENPADYQWLQKQKPGVNSSRHAKCAKSWKTSFYRPLKWTSFNSETDVTDYIFMRFWSKHRSSLYTVHMGVIFSSCRRIWAIFNEKYLDSRNFLVRHFGFFQGLSLRNLSTIFMVSHL